SANGRNGARFRFRSSGIDHWPRRAEVRDVYDRGTAVRAFFEPSGHGARDVGAHFESHGPVGRGAGVLVLLPLLRYSRERNWLLQAVPGTNLVDLMDDASDRVDLPSGPLALTHRSSLRQHVCRRDGDAGLLLAHSSWGSAGVYGLAHGRGVDPGIH